MAVEGDLSQALCRDCFTHQGPAKRCSACASPRLIAHPELLSLSMAHLDCDAFYAAIEKRDNPELAAKPVIVGGGRRGVVSAACYVARTYGIHSAMPMFEAHRRCPDAVVLRPDMTRYKVVSREIRAMLDSLTPLVEPLSLDEAFLDLAGTERLHGAPPAEMLARLAGEIESRLRITVSIGLSYNKFLAKLASDLDKPRGFAVLGEGDARGFLADQAVALLWGVGRAMQARLARDGITRIAQLQTMEETELMRRYGQEGRRLYRLARGLDDRRVTPNAPAKSQSAETTFDSDITGRERLESLLWPLCERVSAALKRKDVAAWTVSLKLKTAHHKLLTRQQRLASPTQLAGVLFEVGRELLARETGASRAYRLIGIGGAELVGAAAADEPDLLDPTRARRASAERAVDALRERFGERAVVKGRSFTQ